MIMRNGYEAARPPEERSRLALIDRPPPFARPDSTSGAKRSGRVPTSHRSKRLSGSSRTQIGASLTNSPTDGCCRRSWC